MAGNTNFPTSLDDDSSLRDVTDNVSTLQAADHNNLKEAVKAIQAKVGVDFTAVPTSLDYRLGHPTDGHRHDGASGQGPPIAASAILGLADVIDESSLGGCKAQWVALECNNEFNAPPNGQNPVPFDTFYDWDFNELPTSLIEGIGLEASINGVITAVEAGVWHADALIQTPSSVPTFLDNFVNVLFMGDTHILHATPGNLSNFKVRNVWPMSTGDNFSLRTGNGQATLTATGIVEYAFISLTRLADKVLF